MRDTGPKAELTARARDSLGEAALAEWPNHSQAEHRHRNNKAVLVNIAAQCLKEDPRLRLGPGLRSDRDEARDRSVSARP